MAIFNTNEFLRKTFSKTIFGTAALRPEAVCADGFTLSIQASGMHRTFNPITRKPLKKISRSLRCCTTKQKNACKTATSGCLVALASKAPII